MSYITHAVLWTGYQSKEQMDAILGMDVPDKGGNGRWGVLDMERAGGTKAFCGTVLAGAFNYLDRFELEKRLRSMDIHRDWMMIVESEDHDSPCVVTHGWEVEGKRRDEGLWPQEPYKPELKERV